MAIRLPQGFDVRSAESIDRRIVLTKEQMRYMNDNLMPVTYIAVCSEDGKLYLYNKENEPLEDTGKFRLANEELVERVTVLEGDVNEIHEDIDGGMALTKEEVHNIVDN